MPRTTASKYAYAETVTRLKETITGAGNTIFATIDQAAAASGAGLELRPTTLLVFGNPKAGTALMQSDPLIGLDLPLKLLVWDDGDTTSVAFTSPAEIAGRYHVEDRAAIVHAMEIALSTLVAAVA